MAKDEQKSAVPATTDQPLPAPLTALERYKPRAVRDQSWDELMAEFDEDQPGFLDAAQVGDGFRVLEAAAQKQHLVGIPLVILPNWRVNPSDKIPGRYFTTIYVKTRNPVAALGDGQHFIVNDGSTGIARQLAEMKEQGFTGMIRCRKGFLVSEYTVTEDAFDDNGKPIIDPMTGRNKGKPVLDPVTDQPIRGTTFYLDDSV